jgi:hypothetical protein
MTDSMRTGTADASGTSTTGRAGSIAERVKNTASTRLNVEKNRATEGLGSVAEAVRETTQKLRDGNHDTLARYADDAAAQIEQFSERLRNKDVTELMRDLQRLARQRPALFIGGAFALGLIGARFFKASAYENEDTIDYGERYYTAPRHNEYRGYAAASGVTSQPSREPSQVHDAAHTTKDVDTLSSPSTVNPGMGVAGGMNAGDQERTSTSRRRTERT